MLEIPGINDLSLGFCGAGQKQSIVDAAAGETPGSGVLDGSDVFVRRERNQSQAIANFFDEKQSLLRWNHRFDGQGGHDRINLGKRVSPAEGMISFCGCEALDAGRMMNMTTPKGSDQNGSIEELLHSRTSRS